MVAGERQREAFPVGERGGRAAGTRCRPLRGVDARRQRVGFNLKVGVAGGERRCWCEIVSATGSGGEW